MANPFLNGAVRDVETAIMLEKAIVHDIGKAVAYTDGSKVFLNTDDNLLDILPAYDPILFKKWLLWHERMHVELRHHERFFTYLKELSLIEKGKDTSFVLTKDEVNIIMDILVHDSMSKMFPEIVPIAIANLAQMRNRNSLGYTFKTHTLEEMLTEYKEHKKTHSGSGGGGTPPTPPKEPKTPGKTGGGTPTSEPSKDEDKEETKEETKEEPRKETKDGDEKTHGEGGSSGEDDESPEDGKPEIKDAPHPEDIDEHDKTDWSKLEEIDTKEFITSSEADRYIEQINRLKRTKIKLAELTKTLNGLATSTRKRTYMRPNPIKVGGGVLLKGSLPGKTPLYLCFDASGSMSRELNIFKEIISKSIPQAMKVPCVWFAGGGARLEPYKIISGEGYYKGQFKDIMTVYASSGFRDDGDRTIELCWEAEQLGYSPIGITDGGGGVSWSKEKLLQLKRTVFVGQEKEWLDAVKRMNPKIQILNI